MIPTQPTLPIDRCECERRRPATRIARVALVRAVVGWLWVAVPLLAVHYWYGWRGVPATFM